MTFKMSKWRGKASAKVASKNADEYAWRFLAEEFCSLNKWFPTLETCIRVEGEEGKPGCVRYCAGFKTHIAQSEENQFNWTKQKLLSVDKGERVFSYAIIDGNVGFNSYVSTVRVVSGDGGCVIEWEYEVEPVEGWKLEDLDSFIGNGLLVMANRMEEALNVATTD